MTRARLLIASLLLILASCGTQKEDEHKVIALSQCTLSDAWRQAMLREMEIALSDYEDYELVVRDADNDCDRQNRQIEELIGMKPDVLIISPAEPQPITEMAERAYEAGIPTIITDRRINSDKYTAFIGGDNMSIGREAGNFASRYLKDGGRALEIWGIAETSPAQERHEGFKKALEDKGLRVTIDTLHGDWLYAKAARRLADKAPGRYDLVYCHNDMMAIAVSEYYKASPYPMPRIIGADAIYGAGLDAVADGRIDISFLYPTCSDELAKACDAIIRGDSLPKWTMLPTGAVDASAAKSMMIQGASIEKYQKSIDRKKDELGELNERFGFLQDSLSIVILLTLALLGLFVTAMVFYRRQKKQTELLEKQKNELELQRRRLEELNSYIEENSRRQLRLFAEISHEIRTPLTLILGPLEKVRRVCNDPAVADDLRVISLNARRLKTEVDLILDLGKVKADKIKLNPAVYDLNGFVADSKTYFDALARQRHINYELRPYPGDIKISFDRSLMEKVIFNLLSNSFKFTPEGGTITLSVINNGSYAGFSVHDTAGGVADPEEAFDYMGSRDYDSGTGIGLYLVKSYAELHGGRATLEDLDGGALFTVLLPASANADMESFEKSAAEYDGTLGEEEQKLLAEINASKHDETILVVDDNEDMLAYVASALEENFNVLRASDGLQALEVISTQQVSAVVSDVMMPHMNGFELCSAIKDEVGYCHIPVVLLTALGSDRHRLQGGLHGADAHLSKPFSADLLKVTVYKLLLGKRKLNEALLRKLMETGAFKSPDVPVESLDDVFLRKLLNRVDEVCADSSYNVEKLSEDIGMSRGHLYRKVKELTGVSPVEFLRHYRLKKAADMLLQHNMSVSEICYAVGFSSPAYFTKCFREYYKCTPSEYKG